MRSHSTLFASALALVACVSFTLACSSSSSGGAGSSAAAATRRLSVAPQSGPPVAIDVAIPAGWTEDASKGSGPAFRIPGAEVHMLGFAALELGADDAAKRMGNAIALQYGSDPKGVERSELSGGRVWMVQREATNIHARMFVPFDRGVLMGFAIMPLESEKILPDIRKAFETIAIVAKP